MAGYIGSKAVSVNTTSATISDDLSVGDDLTVTDDATIGGTLAVTGNLSAANATFSSASPLITGVDTDVDTRIFTIGGNNGNCIIDVDPNGTAGGSLFQVDVDNGEVLKLTSAGAYVTGLLDVSTNAVIDGTALVTGVLTTTAATVFNGGFTANAASTISTDGNEDTLVLKSNDADANAGPKLQFNRNSANPADADLLGEITFSGRNDAGQAVTYAAISSIISDASDGAEGGTLRLKVATHDGELQTGLGLFDGNAEDEIDVFLGRGTASVTTTVGALTVSVGDATLTNGNLVVASGHGIDFTAADSGLAGAVSNLLDDYEEGTVTPTDVSGASLTMAATTGGSYTKIGNIVNFQAKLVFPSTSNTADAKISLPFPIDDRDSYYPTGKNSANGNTYASISIGIVGESYIQFQNDSGSGVSTNANLSGANLNVQLTYQTAT